jgi:hypothetical protein
MNIFTTADRHARTVRRRLLHTVVGIALVVAAVVIGLTGIGVNPDDDPADAAPSTVPTATSTARPQPGVWRVPPVSAGPLILPPPTGTVRGVPVGFPHTVPGAISAAARYAETAIGLDETRARTVGEVASAPSYPSAAADFAIGASSARSRLGVHEPQLGGAFLLFTARSYRVHEATTDRVLVQLLGIVEGAGPATSGQARRATLLPDYTMVWAHGDWKIAGPTNLAEPEPLPAPRSVQAYQGGWRDLALS